MAGPLERFLQIFGALFDSLKTEADLVLSSYDVAEVDVKYIPYIDALIGWPTNFDLNANKRRQETLRAVSLYKTKGRDLTAEAFIEGVADWDATTFQGWKYVMFSNDPRCTTPEPATVPIGLIGTDQDVLKYTPDTTNWHNVNGVLIKLEPVSGITDELVSITVRKIARIVPDLLSSWAQLSLLLSPPASEESVPVMLEEEIGPVPILTLSPELVETPAEVHSAIGGGYALMVSNEASRTTNNHLVRVHHAELGYAGPPPPSPYP